MKIKKNNILILTVKKAVLLQCWKAKTGPFYNNVLKDTRYLVYNQQGKNK
jgi:hypothetical protein